MKGPVRRLLRLCLCHPARWYIGCLAGGWRREQFLSEYTRCNEVHANAYESHRTFQTLTHIVAYCT